MYKDTSSKVKDKLYLVQLPPNRWQCLEGLCGAACLRLRPREATLESGPECEEAPQQAQATPFHSVLRIQPSSDTQSAQQRCHTEPLAGTAVESKHGLTEFSDVGPSTDGHCTFEKQLCFLLGLDRDWTPDQGTSGDHATRASHHEWGVV